MKNSNYETMHMLAEAYYEKNKARNRILICAVALSMFLVYTTFAIISGKLETDFLLYARNGGTITNTYLENGSEAQYENLKQLAYIKNVGIKVYAGEAKTENHEFGILQYLDKTGFEELASPAYSDICGAYPKEKNEVMLPVRLLKDAKIENPKVGMVIPLTIEMENNGYKKEEMILSGYYTDYVEPGIFAPIIYVSEAYLKERHRSIFPADELMILQDSAYDAAEIEENLYKDIGTEYDSQQFLGQNTLARQSMEDLFGSYFIMGCCCVIILISAFLLIYNVINISTKREVKQYSLLKIIGCTMKQLKAVMIQQNIRIITKGVLLGGSIGGISIALLSRMVFEKLFLSGKGSADTVPVFYPKYLLLALALTVLTTILAMNYAVKKVIKMSAIEGLKYSDDKNVWKYRRNHSKKGASMIQMAWRNIVRSPIRFVIILISLFIGYTIALGTAVITKGTDTTNHIMENPDFRISSMVEMNMISEHIPNEFSDDTPVFSREALDAIKNMKGIEEILISRGSYAVICPQEDTAMLPKMKACGREGLAEDFAVLQIVDDDYLGRLEEYVKEKELPVDMDALKKGDGVMLLHHHELSSILEQEAQAIYGEKIQFYSLDSFGAENKTKFKLGELECAGYLDLKAKNFPTLQMTANGNQINYFIISEEGFKKSGLFEKCFVVALNAEDGKEPIMKQQIEKLVQDENKATQDWNQFLLFCTSDLLEAARNYITATNLVLGTLGLVLLFIGIMNYFNTIMTSIQVRNQEFVTMECIGMTGKQLRTLLITEGLWYWGIVLVFELTAGQALLRLMGKGIKENLAYFRFYYPWSNFVALAIILLLVTVMIAEYMYRQTRKGSVVEKMRSV